MPRLGRGRRGSARSPARGVLGGRGGLRRSDARAEGRDGLSRHIAGFQEQWPGYRIDVITGPDGHGPHLRFGWAMKRPDGSVELEGMDYAEVGGGRLTRIVGFFGSAELRCGSSSSAPGSAASRRASCWPATATPSRCSSATRRPCRTRPATPGRRGIAAASPSSARRTTSSRVPARCSRRAARRARRVRRGRRRARGAAPPAPADHHRSRPAAGRRAARARSPGAAPTFERVMAARRGRGAVARASAAARA